MKKEIRAWLIIAALQLAWIGPCVYDATTRAQAEQKETTEDVLHSDLEKAEVEVEVTEEEKVTIQPNHIDDIRYYDVPLDEALQMHTFIECDGYSIAPAVVLAIMDAESDFNLNAVSPYGDIGIMQINPKWHKDRMDKLGCTDLFDPYQNISVGINYLAYLIDANPDIYWVLMAYNKGPNYATDMLEQGKVNDYAIEVLERAHELEAKYASNR